MATEAFGLPFEVGTLSAWLVWILPFAAAMIIPGVGKLSKHATGYVAVAFALMSALSAATMIPVALEAGELHHQVMWIDALGLKGGTHTETRAHTHAHTHTHTHTHTHAHASLYSPTNYSSQKTFFVMTKMVSHLSRHPGKTWLHLIEK